MATPKSILITGASSGIGAALAKAYATPEVTLFLNARNSEKLARVAAECRELGAQVLTAEIDVTERNALRAWIEACDKQQPLELVIANAGIANAGKGCNQEHERKIFEINLFGVLNTIYPAIDLMTPRNQGQIVIMSSLAAMYGLSRAPAYSASKAGLKILGSSLRKRLKKHNIKVLVACPGFVKTALTAANNYPMPFILSPEQTAKRIINGLKHNKGLILFPKRLYYIIRFFRLLPRKFTQRELRRRMKKQH